MEDYARPKRKLEHLNAKKTSSAAVAEMADRTALDILGLKVA